MVNIIDKEKGLGGRRYQDKRKIRGKVKRKPAKKHGGIFAHKNTCLLVHNIMLSANNVMTDNMDQQVVNQSFDLFCMKKAPTNEESADGDQSNQPIVKKSGQKIKKKKENTDDRKKYLQRGVEILAKIIARKLLGDKEQKRFKKIAIDFFGRDLLIKITPQSFANRYDELPFGLAASAGNHSQITPIIWAVFVQKINTPNSSEKEIVNNIRHVFDEEISGTTSTNKLNAVQKNRQIEGFVNSMGWRESKWIDEAVDIVKYYDKLSPGFAIEIEKHAIDLAFCAEKKRAVKLRIMQDLFHRQIAPLSPQFKKRIRRRSQRAG